MIVERECSVNLSLTTPFSGHISHNYVNIIVCSHGTVIPSTWLELSPLWSTTLGIYPSLPY